MKLDYLVFGAHPDDVELFCGGTICKISTSGKSIGIVDLTRGEKGSRGTPEEREKEAEKSAKVLGVKIRENLHIPDTELVNNRENQLKIIKVLRQYKPEIIIIPYRKARHPDHKDAHYLINDAVYYSGLLNIKTENSPYRPRTTICYLNNFEVIPSFIIDISNEFTKKIEALKTYKTQFFNLDYKGYQTLISSGKFFEFVETKAKFYGFMISKDYGEPFIVDTPFELKEIDNFLKQSYEI